MKPRVGRWPKAVSVAKNTCGDMTQDDLIAALGVPKNSYYRYIKADGYPLGEDFRTQKAWMDAKRGDAGGSGSGKGCGKGKGSDEHEGEVGPVEGTKAFYEVEKLKYQALNEQLKAKETVQAIVSHAESHLRRRLGKLIERLSEVTQQRLCKDCSGLIADEWETAMIEMREEI